MAQVRNKSQQSRRKAATPEARDAYMSALAYDAAEQRLKEGKASSQEILYFLQLGSPEHQIDKQIKKNQAEMLQAKAEALKSAKRTEELYRKAMQSMREYAGDSLNDEDEWDD